MSDFLKNVKTLLTRGAKGVGRTASRVAKETKFKTSEMSELSKKRELISELGSKVYGLAQDGLVLPAEAAEIVHQLTVLDQILILLRSNRDAQHAAYAQQRAEEKAERAAEKAAAKTAAAIQMSTAPVEVEMPEPEASVNSAVLENAPACPTLEVEDSAVETPDDANIPTLNV